MRHERFYLIWSIEHSGWWRPHGEGYTKDINEAGQYSETRALEICQDANFWLGRKAGATPNEAMVPLHEVKMKEEKPNG